MRPWPSLAVLPLIVLSTACAEPEPSADDVEVVGQADTASAAQDPAAVREEIERRNSAFAESMNAGDVAAAMDVYTEDARIFPPDAPMMEGREALTEFWQAGIEQMEMTDFHLTTEEVEVSGDLAVEQGRASFTTTQGPAEAHYIVVWKRGPDGQWRWHRDIWNMTPPVESADD